MSIQRARDVVTWAGTVRIDWVYVGNDAACVATLGEQSLMWRGQGIGVTEAQRENVPKQLARELTRRLPPPKLGQVYYRHHPTGDVATCGTMTA